ncbi:DNA adenine methylase [Mobilicoccus sp.]|uniref:DNA adenine methylase n=1 Tax=Mobilicoccus sp. TaxID=2034349 RepID=UPI0028A7E417|nr:DNA adenine methylase [Mobilicoccus sp.]
MSATRLPYQETRAHLRQTAPGAAPVIRAKRRYGTLSPLRYPGGKAALAGLFADLIDDLHLTSGIYVEPYAGGAGAGVALLRHGLVDRLIINDIDPAVHAFWQAVVKHNGELVDRIANTPISLTEWHHQREIYRSGTAHGLDLAFAFFFLNRTNRSGVLNAGVIGGQAQNGRYKIDARFNRETLTERLAALGALADRIEVTDLDGRTVIQKYADNPHVFMYIDPPYVRAGSDLYLNAFERRDHQALAAAIAKTTAAHWLLTYDVSPLVEQLYEDFFQARLALNYSARHPGMANELVVASPSVADALRARLGGEAAAAAAVQAAPTHP